MPASAKQRRIKAIRAVQHDASVQCFGGPFMPNCGGSLSSHLFECGRAACALVRVLCDASRHWPHPLTGSDALKFGWFSCQKSPSVRGMSPRLTKRRAGIAGTEQLSFRIQRKQACRPGAAKPQNARSVETGRSNGAAAMFTTGQSSSNSGCPLAIARHDRSINGFQYIKGRAARTAVAALAIRDLFFRRQITTSIAHVVAAGKRSDTVGRSDRTAAQAGSCGLMPKDPRIAHLQVTHIDFASGRSDDHLGVARPPARSKAREDSLRAKPRIPCTSSIRRRAHPRDSGGASTINGRRALARKMAGDLPPDPVPAPQQYHFHKCGSFGVKALACVTQLGLCPLLTVICQCIWNDRWLKMQGSIQMFRVARNRCKSQLMRKAALIIWAVALHWRRLARPPKNLLQNPRTLFASRNRRWPGRHYNARSMHLANRVPLVWH